MKTKGLLEGIPADIFARIFGATPSSRTSKNSLEYRSFDLQALTVINPFWNLLNRHKSYLNKLKRLWHPTESSKMPWNALKCRKMAWNASGTSENFHETDPRACASKAPLTRFETAWNASESLPKIPMTLTRELKQPSNTAQKPFETPWNTLECLKMPYALKYPLKLPWNRPKSQCRPLKSLLNRQKRPETFWDALKCF